MTVAELIAELRNYPQSAPVFMKSDPEGNGTYSADGPFVGFFREDRGVLSQVHPDDIEGGELEAVVIWPGYGESFDE